MLCVMGCVMAATEFFLGGSFLLQGEGRDRDRDGSEAGAGSKRSKSMEEGDRRGGDPPPPSLLLPPCDPDRTRECEEEGLEISEELLRRRRRRRSGLREGAAASADNNDIGSVGGGGGRWDYTIGLVGKPSAGKSTFFNAATAFARQRGGGGGGKDGGGAEGNGDSTDGTDGDGDGGRTTPFFIGGASMAPHPFTTIDPNVGYCLVPAPAGSCPEDDYDYDDHDEEGKGEGGRGGYVTSSGAAAGYERSPRRMAGIERVGGSSPPPSRTWRGWFPEPTGDGGRGTRYEKGG